MAKSKTVMGIDLSLVGTGIVILKEGKRFEQELIKSKPVGEKPIDEVKRIRKIVEEIEFLVSENSPAMAIIEGMAFMARNTTALVQLAALNYMTRAMLIDYNVPFIIVAPTSLKKFITGNGASKKDVMLIETYKRYGVSIVDDNICDAYGLAQIGRCLIDTLGGKFNQRQGEVLELLKKQK